MQCNRSSSSSFVVVVVALEGEGSKTKGARCKTKGGQVEDGMQDGCRWWVVAPVCLLASMLGFFVSFTFYFLVRPVSTTTTDYLAAI